MFTGAKEKAKEKGKEKDEALHLLVGSLFCNLLSRVDGENDR